MEQLQTLANTLVNELNSYNTKPTKAASKRIRMTLLSIKKSTPGFRQMLIDLDKNQAA